MLKTSCLGLQTKICSQKRKHCILRWKALHRLHGNVHNISGRIWAVYQFASESIGFALQIKVLKTLQNLVNAFFYCYLFLIADFASFWMLQNYFMLCYLFLIADFASFWMLQNYFMLALLLIFNCRFYAYFWKNIIFSCMRTVPRFVSHQQFRGVVFEKKFYLGWNTSNTYV